jgi:hypothetical protein
VVTLQVSLDVLDGFRDLCRGGMDLFGSLLDRFGQSGGRVGLDCFDFDFRRHCRGSNFRSRGNNFRSRGNNVSRRSRIERSRNRSLRNRLDQSLGALGRHEDILAVRADGVGGLAFDHLGKHAGAGVELGLLLCLLLQRFLARRIALASILSLKLIRAGDERRLGAQHRGNDLRDGAVTHRPFVRDQPQALDAFLRLSKRGRVSPAL